MPGNSVYLDHKDGKWYFWDETETDRIGPYATESKAKAGMAVYAADLGDKVTVTLQKDGDQWCATIHGAFLDLQNSFAGFGPTKDTAVADLFRSIKTDGYYEDEQMRIRAGLKKMSDNNYEGV